MPGVVVASTVGAGFNFNIVFLTISNVSGNALCNVAVLAGTKSIIPKKETY